MEYRKIQLIGGSSYAITLPKSWISEVKLKPGDFVTIQRQSDLSLIVVPQRTSREIGHLRGEATVEVGGEVELENVFRTVVGLYLVGYSGIRIRFLKRYSEMRGQLIELIRRKLLGVEVMDERSNEILLQTFIEFKEFPTLKLITRMFTLVQSMLEDSVAALLGKDHELAGEVIKRDDNVDRLYLLSVRQLKRAVEDRNILRELEIRDFRHVLGYRLVTKSIERAADHATRIAEIASKLEEPVAEELSEIFKEIVNLSSNMFENSWRALVKIDMDLADKTIDQREEVWKLVEKASITILEKYRKPETIMGLSLALESLKRIAEYACDISEIVINLAVAMKEKMKIGI